MRKALGSFQSTLLFPGDEINGEFGINANPAVFDAAKAAPGYSGNLVLLTCAVYGSTLYDTLHQTGKAYAVFRNNAKIDISGAVTAINDILIIPQPMGGSYAN